MITVIIKSGVTNSISSKEESSLLFFSQHMNINFSSLPHFWQPATDIYETQEKFIVVLEISGVHEEDIHIVFENNMLNISGYRSLPVEDRQSIHRMEIRFGEFHSILAIPGTIDSNNIEALYDNGFLMVFLPKEKPNSVQIHVDQDVTHGSI